MAWRIGGCGSSRDASTKPQMQPKAVPRPVRCSERVQRDTGMAACRILFLAVELGTGRGPLRVLHGEEIGKYVVGRLWSVGHRARLG